MLDAFCVEHQLEVEVDGNIHLNPSQKEHDDIRAAFLQANEIRILRFKNEEIMNDLALVLEKIIRATHSPSPDDDVGHQERGLGGEA